MTEQTNDEGYPIEVLVYDMTNQPESDLAPGFYWDLHNPEVPIEAHEPHLIGPCLTAEFALAEAQNFIKDAMTDFTAQAGEQPA